MPEYMTRVNINQFLIDVIGIDPDEVSLMPDYVKKDIVEGEYDLFLDFMDEEV